MGATSTHRGGPGWSYHVTEVGTDAHSATKPTTATERHRSQGERPARAPPPAPPLRPVQHRRRRTDATSTASTEARSTRPDRSRSRVLLRRARRHRIPRASPRRRDDPQGGHPDRPGRDARPLPHRHHRPAASCGTPMHSSSHRTRSCSSITSLTRRSAACWNSTNGTTRPAAGCSHGANSTILRGGCVAAPAAPPRRCRG